ncbi:MAG: class II glutamine amidotransferase [Deltaproteobacteria bacterium]|nr:class II glutamine amidotransferase [Deltaproteobacteria bacterium]
MCELLGLDCNTPTDAVFSFTGLCSRGGKTGAHVDGWGIAFYDGRAARVFLDPQPAVRSPLAELLRTWPLRSLIIVAHIRRRTRGPTSLPNTHPFTRELWGRHWTFAHNGTVPGARRLKLGRFRPIGTTDSEHVFCHLLEVLRSELGDYPRSPRTLVDLIAKASRRIANDGTLNYLLSDSHRLYARSSTSLFHIIRQAPFGQATLSDDEVKVNFADLTTPRDRVAVVATRPLTRDERWTAGNPGELWVFENGALRFSVDSRGKQDGRAQAFQARGRARDQSRAADGVSP